MQNLYCSIFCHTIEENIDFAQEDLMQQYYLLNSYAKENHMTVEHCFFHTGTIDVNNPDPVLEGCLQAANRGTLGLVLVTDFEKLRGEMFPGILLTEVYSPLEERYIRLGRRIKKQCTRKDNIKVMYYARPHSSDCGFG